MSDVWFTSDTHFRHPMVAKLRGYPTVEAHDEEVIHRWNSVVTKHDQVWHLGDVGMGKGFLNDCVTRLNGEVNLITGNHDAPWPGNRRSHVAQRRWSLYFASVQAFATRKIDGRDVLLSHFPYEADHTYTPRHNAYRLRDEGMPLLHGHLHCANQWTGDLQVHVGVDAWQLTPVNLQDVSDVLRSAYKIRDAETKMWNEKKEKKTL